MNAYCLKKNEAGWPEKNANIWLKGKTWAKRQDSHAQWPKTLSPKRMKNNILAEWEMDGYGGK